MSETVLIVGATGNIGVAAAHGALKSGLKVLAIVRNEKSAQKLFDALNTKDGITTVEADITSETGVQTVVQQVRAGKLPAFQHVYSSAGGSYDMESLKDLSVKTLHKNLEFNFWPNFYAYHATIDYLLEQNNPNASWTLITGAEGDKGRFAGPAISQGPLFSMAAAAAHENANTNVRFNEVYLAFWVKIDSVAEAGAMKASEFGENYVELLKRPDIRSSRVFVTEESDVKNLRAEKKGSVDGKSG